MGLDMFLMRMDGTEAGYWRKANHIHNWFVTNVQNGVDDCEKYPVSYEKLAELRDLCKKVLDSHDLAESLLPTVSGFFFGSINYDSDYFEDLELSIKVIDQVLQECNHENLYYQSSW